MAKVLDSVPAFRSERFALVGTRTGIVSAGGESERGDYGRSPESSKQYLFKHDIPPFFTGLLFRQFRHKHVLAIAALVIAVAPMYPFMLRIVHVARRTDNGRVDTTQRFVGTPVLFPLAFEAHEYCMFSRSGGSLYVTFQDAAILQAGIPYGGIDLLPEARTQAFIFNIPCAINSPCPLV
jgi:hypothetical protein